MDKKVMKLASRGKRFGAYCIDRVIPFIILFTSWTYLLTFTPQSSLDPFGFDMGMGYGFDYSVIGNLFRFLILNILFLSYLGVQIAFYTKSKTIGKAIMGLQVISSKDGTPVNVWKMLIREWFAKKASAAVFLLGFIWIFIDDKNRCWHDKIVDTYVIDIKQPVEINSEQVGDEYAGGEISG